MTMTHQFDPVTIGTHLESVQALIAEVTMHTVEREELALILVTSMIAREHALAIGMTGVAKSMVGDEILYRISDAKIGSFQLGKGASQSELIGPMSLRALKEHDIQRFNTTNMLPDVEYAILDEVFNANALARNKALRILAEGQFDNGGERVHSILRWMLSTCNDISLALEDTAFYDRILVRVFVDRVQDPDNRARMINMGVLRRRGLQTYPATISKLALEELQEARHTITIPDDVHRVHQRLWTTLDLEGFSFGDRRDVGTMGLAQARALMAGRTALIPSDLNVYEYTAWNDPADASRVRKIVIQVVNPNLHQVMEIVDAIEVGYEKMLDERKQTTDIRDQVAASSRFQHAAQTQEAELVAIIDDLIANGEDTVIAKQALVKLRMRLSQSSIFQAGP